MPDETRLDDYGLPLWRSYISSCSERVLSDLLRECAAINTVRRFDLYLVRRVDLDDIQGRFTQPLSATPLPYQHHNVTRMLACREHRPIIQSWIQRCLAEAGGPFEIAALATYFPEISSLSGATDPYPFPTPEELTRSVLAERALTNSILLALDMHQAGIMPQVVVEMVCGTILDPCWCRDCRSAAENGSATEHYVLEFPMVQKRQALLDSLACVIQNVYENHELAARIPWAVALELEPGEVYLLRDLQTVNDLFADIEQHPFGELLQKHVGLNLDIAHMKIAGVSAHELYRHRDRIVHAHICDHPRMHTLDQSLGRWSAVHRFEGPDYPYLLLLDDIRWEMEKQKPRQLPFSRSVALELEGCNRIAWIHESLTALKQEFFSLKYHRDRICELYDWPPDGQGAG